MANISVRNLDKQAYELLRARAVRHGVSMEEEARQIIYQVVSQPKKMSSVFQKHFGRKHGVSLNIKRDKPHDPMDISE